MEDIFVLIVERFEFRVESLLNGDDSDEGD